MDKRSLDELFKLLPDKWACSSTYARDGGGQFFEEAG